MNDQHRTILDTMYSESFVERLFRSSDIASHEERIDKLFDDAFFNKNKTKKTWPNKKGAASHYTS